MPRFLDEENSYLPMSGSVDFRDAAVRVPSGDIKNTEGDREARLVSDTLTSLVGETLWYQFRNRLIFTSGSAGSLVFPRTSGVI